MTHLQITVLDQPADVFRKRHQAQQVCHRGTGFPHSRCHLLLRELKLFLQALQCRGFFNRVEVFTLDILDQGHRNGSLVRHIANNRGYNIQSRHLRGPPTALTRDNFISLVRNWSHDDGLHNALGGNAVRQLFQ